MYVLYNVTCFIVPMLLSWTGNDNIHWLTRGKRQRLRIELEDFDGKVRYADYDDFRVESEELKYQLTLLGRYSGNAGQ